MTEKPTRIEKDSMGEMTVPADALHGASTHRAVLNFPVSGYRFPRPFIRALGLIKWAAAKANQDLGLLDANQATAIAQAAEEVAEGKLDDHFPLDIFQTGSGTSTNTNANEVIANRSAHLSGKSIGSHDPVHPNDHVNMGQSSNDVIPSAIHISAAEELKNHLIPALEKLHERPRSQGERILARHQDWAHAFDGRDAGATRTGILRLRATGRVCEGARGESDRSFARGCARRDRSRHWSESPYRFSQESAAPHQAAHRDSILRGEKSFRSPRRQGRSCRGERPLKNYRRKLSSKLRTIFAGSAAGRGAASAKFNCLPRNRAARSCREK